MLPERRTGSFHKSGSQGLLRQHLLLHTSTQTTRDFNQLEITWITVTVSSRAEISPPTGAAPSPSPSVRCPSLSHLLTWRNPPQESTHRHLLSPGLAQMGKEQTSDAV